MLFVPHEGMATLRQQITDPWVGESARKLLEKADALIDAAPLSYALDRRGILLDVARQISDRIQTLGVGWMISANPRLRRRIIDELLSVATFPDWNPAHFIDTAEIMAAVAMGRSWAGPLFKRSEDELIADALIRLGLIPARSSFRRPSPWVTANNNWTVVCSSASILAALSLQQAGSPIVEEVFRSAKATFGSALQSFEPDGGWHEGPGYWALATDYAVMGLAALEAAGDREIQMPRSFAETWRFGQALTSPSGKSFDYGDNLLISERCHGLGWLARRSGSLPAAAWQRQAPGEPRPFDILWNTTPAPAAQPRATVERFETAGVSILTDGNIWVGLKGGSNAANHAHLDLGTIVLEIAGKRFLSELGRQDYAMPGYFKPDKRFGYFRTRTEAHNTISFGQANQSLHASAVDLGRPASEAISAAYAVNDPEAPGRFSRAVEIVPGRGVVVADRITPAGQGAFEADWFGYTSTQVTLHDGGASLSLDGTDLAFKVSAPFEVRPLLEPAPCPLGESDNSGFRRLRIPLAIDAKPLTLTTMFSADPAEMQELAIRGAKLQDWLANQRP